jgi:hypothetical protein
VKLIHEGKSTHRLNDNPLERAYHDAWIAENKGDLCRGVGILQWLLGDNNNPADDMSERDAMVAATVIQWLGSPVGQCFIDKVKAKS